MKNSLKITIGILLFFVVLWACTTKQAAVSSTSGNGLPQNVQVSCTVAKDTFNHWFVSGQPTENGAVTPANSVAFPHNNNCDFYTWAEHMFLWITSPATAPNSGHKSVLESPVFYTVSPEDSSAQRVLIPHDTIHPLKFTAKLNENGPDRLPVILSKSGKIFEVEEPRPGAAVPQAVKGADGKIVPVGSVKAGANGQALFMDKAGKPIQNPVPVISHKANAKNIVEKFMMGNKPVFLDSQGKQVETEAGQATGDVLMDRNGSLVYYLSMVNDVYAWFLTATNNHYMSGNEFPTTSADRDSICAYARKNGVTLADSNALAMELKTSWVEASKLADPQNYFTVMATIPTYDTTSNVKWTPKPNGEKTVKMALVGIHIVGSLAHHPEMAWATLEHLHITPNAKYTYVDNKNNVDTVSQDTGNDWLFSSNAADTSPNLSHMQAAKIPGTRIATDTIVAKAPFTISASNTLMDYPWGSAMGQPVNAEDKTSAASNSEVISINNTIYSYLVGNDIRKQYLLIGATWTNGGAPPTGVSYGVGGDTTAGVSIGTSVLANSTMETYFQSNQNSCFTCHSGPTPSLKPGDLSHVFTAIQPLATKTNSGNSQKKKK